MEGRFHFYEDYSMEQITLPVRRNEISGGKTLIDIRCPQDHQSNFRKGDIMVIVDHINLLGQNPLIGPNDDPLVRVFRHERAVFKKVD